MCWAARTAYRSPLLLAIGVLFGVCLVGCRPDIPMVSLGIDDAYAVPRMKSLVLHPQFEGSRYVWSAFDGAGRDSVVTEERDLVFFSADTGVFRYRLRIEDPENPCTHEVVIAVWEEEVAYSPYISRVYEYCPAPGQFVNLMPVYEKGDTYASMCRKAEQSIAGTRNELISLGAYGGYVTFGFDHSVRNVAGEYDFRIYGNAFYAESVTKTGASEPGIVAVSLDRNRNGLPDDEWFELAGSEYRKPETVHHYQIVYTRSEGTDILYTDNMGGAGCIPRNTFHTQDYFPQWVEGTSLRFGGTRLADNFRQEGGSYAFFPYDWGYADNHPNEEAEKSSFNIDWAVDGNGTPVHLPCIDFVRVYTGVNQVCGPLGETSTEISKAEDLHPL